MTQWEKEAWPALISELVFFFLESASAWRVFSTGRLIGDGAQGRTKLEAPFRQARQGSNLCWEGQGPGEQGLRVFMGMGWEPQAPARCQMPSEIREAGEILGWVASVRSNRDSREQSFFK